MSKVLATPKFGLHAAMRALLLAALCSSASAKSARGNGLLGLHQASWKFSHLNQSGLFSSQCVDRGGRLPYFCAESKSYWTWVARMLSAGLVSRSEMMCAFAHTKSQLHEDLRLLHAILLAGKRGPPDRQNTFVELGALNGVYLSNTYMLQKCFGWRGVLIEANPTSFAALSGNSGRCDTAKFTKPSTAKCVHAAVCPGNGRAPDGTKTVVNFAAGGSIPEVTADVDSMSKGFRDKWFAGQAKLQTVEVPCRSLESILASAGLPNGASFLSLDVEGAEEKVIRTVNASKFDLVMVESDGHDLAKDRRVDEYLVAAKLKQPQKSLHLHTVANSGVYASEGIVNDLIQMATSVVEQPGAAHDEGATAAPSTSSAPAPHPHAHHGAKFKKPPPITDTMTRVVKRD